MLSITSPFYVHSQPCPGGAPAGSDGSGPGVARTVLVKDRAALKHSTSLRSNKSVFLGALGAGGSAPLVSFWSPGWTMIIKTVLRLWFL